MIGVMQFEQDELEFVEVDPTGRYGRYNEILGRGASKTVYKAFDEYEGIEVAWNQVKLCDFLRSPEDLERLYCEIHLLKTLEHKNIMKFYSSWVDVANRNINFITEMFTSGTLRQYRLKHKRVNIRAVKQWCRQILEGLHYLHSHDPPVIHRDLKCDNIFVNGNQGQVKIGDLGLAAILRKSHAAHVVGTPEFMAPEVYLEEYNELVDIYAFGMCILEMVVFEYPYSECTHPAQIYKKVIAGKKPDALYKVKDPEVREFIDKCLATVSSRLSAKELLDDPFLRIDDGKLVSKETRYEKELDYGDPVPKQPFAEIDYKEKTYSDGSSNDYPNEYTLEDQNGQSYDRNDSGQSGINLFDMNDDRAADLNITIKGKQREDGSIFLRIRIFDKEGQVRNIYFPFDIETDTALSVATEMVAELDINDQDVTEIANMIDDEIMSLVPDWKPGPGIEEAPRDSNFSFCHNCGSSITSTESIMNLLMNDLGSSSHFAQCLGNKCAVSHGRFEEITYQIDKSPQHDASNPANSDLATSSLSNGFHHRKILDRRGSHSSEETDYLEATKKLDREVPSKEEQDLKQGNESLFSARNHKRSLSSSQSLAAALSKDSTNHEHIQKDLRWLEELHRKKLSELQDQEFGFLPRSKSLRGTKSKTHKIKKRISSFRAFIPRSSKMRRTGSKTSKIMKGISSFRELIPRSSKSPGTVSKTQKIKKGISSFRALIKSSVRPHKKKTSDVLQTDDQESSTNLGSKKARKSRAKKVSAKVKDLLSPRSFRNDKLMLSPHDNATSFRADVVSL